ncbi:hypothetical protein EDD21DRAFT_319648 [Dissophora ornata]|nr:hypothetical protein EDD21DRAFT_319648 [Dissophora ornata]
MSGISTRIDKAQTRFAPKLKARPSRNKAGASEDGTPAPTPPVGGSDSGAFVSSQLESETASTTSSNSASASTPAVPVNIPQKEPSRRMSTVTPMSPPPTHSRTITSPRSPTFTVAKVHKTNQTTPISIPPQRAAAEPISTSAAGSSSASSSAAPSKSTKGVSIISVPTARSRSELEDTEEAEAAEIAASARKRSKGKAIRSRIHVDEVEEETEDGEEGMPDYVNMFMYEFVKDLGRGRRSKVYAEQEKMLNEKRKQNKKEERIRAIRRMEGRGPSPPRTFREGEEGEDELIDEDEPQNKDVKLAKSESSLSMSAPITKTFAPQVRVIDGRIELDLDSLTVDHAAVEAPLHQGPMEYVEESSSTKFVNSATYTKKITSERWTAQETERFYEAIAQWGTDFGIICRLFPSKTRTAVKNKYKREDRYNHTRVEEAMNSRTPIDLEKYSQMTDTAFPEVSEIEKQPEDDEDEQPLFPENAFEEQFDEDEDVVQDDISYEEEEEEIVGTIE